MRAAAGKGQGPDGLLARPENYYLLAGDRKNEFELTGPSTRTKPSRCRTARTGSWQRQGDPGDVDGASRRSLADSAYSPANTMVMTLKNAWPRLAVRYRRRVLKPDRHRGRAPPAIGCGPYPLCCVLPTKSLFASKGGGDTAKPTGYLPSLVRIRDAVLHGAPVRPHAQIHGYAPPSRPSRTPTPPTSPRFMSQLPPARVRPATRGSFRGWLFTVVPQRPAHLPQRLPGQITRTAVRADGWIYFGSRRDAERARHPISNFPHGFLACTITRVAGRFCPIGTESRPAAGTTVRGL